MPQTRNHGRHQESGTKMKEREKDLTDDFQHLREEPSKLKFCSKLDFEYLDNVGAKTEFISAVIVLGWFFFFIAIGLFSFFFLKGDPVKAFFDSRYCFATLLVIFLLFYSIYSHTKRFKRDVVQLKCAFLLKHQFEKGEREIIKGMKTKKIQLIQNGVERLEGLNEYFSEMPEYNELLEKGKSWLKENEGK
jgi:hypothetical protein